MRFLSRFLLVCTLLALLAALPGSPASVQAGTQQQEDAAVQKARQMLAQLTAEEKVGQIFLVTFQGSTFDENSQIYSLISEYHVGGVILERANDNFSTVENIPGQAISLNRLLQEARWNASQRTIQRAGNSTPYQPNYIPLLIGISQEGDNFPNDQLLYGMTPLPNEMAIGATWSADLAQQVGLVMGEELAALGFNLYIGPSLDVLEAPREETADVLGGRSFGGSAYWVGKLGKAYISGLHEGSGGRLMVISKHFPGLGGADRSPESEIATVRKPLDQLEEVDLAPFAEVAASGADADRAAVTDGMLVSHVRYQGLQGTIRTTTRPVSSDAAALEQILKTDPFAQWRAQGGVLISDNLGSQAVRRFYDPSNNAFDARTVAREAFVAGNDMLYVDRFVSSNDPDTYTTLTRTIDYFAQKYREDAVFAQRVDASVERILAMKYRLYPDFLVNRVTVQDVGLEEIGQSQAVTFDVARRAVTMISPEAEDLPNILPRGPEPRDRIVFLTDVQAARQCTGCIDSTPLTVDALQTAVLRLYGPRAGGQISQNLLTSYSFSDLSKYLTNLSTGSTDQASTLEDDLRIADWVVVSILKPDARFPDTLAFKRLLSERPDLIRNKKVVAFAFGAPYYLDATDISKLSAYYGMYSKTAPFIEVAARILFQDLFAAEAGALPVSVTGVGYDIQYITSPDPAQVISLFIDSNQQQVSPVIGTLEPTPVPMFRVDDILPLRTGVIYDRNGNPVPDGTPVRFLYSVISESSGSTLTQADAETVDGVARAMYRIDRPGLLEIRVDSGEGALSNLVRLDITTGVSAGVTVVAPTPMPTETSTPTPTVTPTQQPSPTPTPIPPAVVKFQDWLLSVVIMVLGALVVSWLGIRWAIARWGLRWALCGVIGGLLFYNYLALGFPGSEDLIRGAGTPGIVLITFTGVVFGWGIGLIWRQADNRPGRPGGERGSGDRPVTGPKSQ